MKLIKLDAKELVIPFRVNFKHTLADRNKTETVIVVAESEGGETGFGEGCPRNYVTGENGDAAIRFIDKYKSLIMEISCLEDIKSFIIQYSLEIDMNPAAWCAVETALLDLLGKENRATIEELLKLPGLKSEYKYSAVIGDWDDHVANNYIQQYLKLQFDDFKIKLSGVLKRDLFKIRQLEPGDCDNIKIRADANKLWADCAEACNYMKRLNHKLFAIEEPLMEFHYDDLINLSKMLDIKIILDESFARLEDFNKIKYSSDRFIINIRVSKMGGILRSLEIVKRAVREGYSVIVGAQVGETSILSRAALAVVNECGENIIGQEGAFGNYLLSDDISEPQIKFGEKGIFKTTNLNATGIFGLGLNVAV